MTALGQARTYQCTGCLAQINWAQHLAQLDRCDKCAKCGICGVSFRRNEIPYQALCGDELFHQECYREHYGAVEFEPDGSYLIARPRNGKRNSNYAKQCRMDCRLQPKL